MKLTKQTFENLKSKIFNIEFESNLFLNCHLIEVKEMDSQAINDKNTESFSLLFKSEDTRVFEQNTYKLINDELNEVLLFLVPISSDEKGVSYEAIFN